MSNNNRNFIREECDRCGAPLSRAKQKGKFICQYCGAVFYDNNYSMSDWEENIDILETPEKSQMEPIIPPTQLPKKNKKHNLIIIVVIGAFAILCMIVYLVINGKNDPKTTSENLNQAVSKPEMLNQLPQAVKAGESIAYANWELTVRPEIAVDDNRISISIILQNWNDNQQTFRYKPNTIIVYDDLDNEYPLYLGNCEPDIPYMDRQITFEPNEEVKFESASFWCNRAYHLPLYSGVIPFDADHLYIYFEEFGVFQNITFVIGL